MVVIAVQPGLQQVMALLVGGERLAVGPLLEQGAVEALHLAVELRAVGRDEDAPGPDLRQRHLVVAPVAVGPGIVGHHRLKANAACREPGQGPPNEPADRAGGLVAVHLTEGQAGMIIDQGVDEVIAQASPLLPVPSRPTSAPVHEVTAASRNAGQLLDVHVPQLAGLPHLVAADPLPVRAIQPVEAVPLVPAQHPVAGRARQPTQGGEPMRTQPPTAKLQHLRLPGGIQSPRRAARPTRSGPPARPTPRPGTAAATCTRSPARPPPIRPLPVPTIPARIDPSTVAG